MLVFGGVNGFLRRWKPCQTSATFGKEEIHLLMTQLRGEIAAELREMHRRELNNFSLQCLNEMRVLGRFPNGWAFLENDDLFGCFFWGEDWENPLQNIFNTIYRGYEFTIWKFKINHHELN